MAPNPPTDPVSGQFEPLPTQSLRGRRIVVTRTRQQAGTLSAGLQRLGAEVIELPTIEIVPPESYEPLDAALRSLKSYDWLIITSANTARIIGERLKILGLDVRAHEFVKIAAIGPSTAAAIEALGRGADLIAADSIGEGLVESLRELLGERLRGMRVLLARAAIARDIVPMELAKSGALVTIVEAYRTVIPAESVEQVRRLFAKRLAEGAAHASRLPDAVAFTSSSTVNHFFSLLREAAAKLPPTVKAISIGPVTSATLREHSWEPACEALQHDMQGLIDAAVGILGANTD